MARNMILLDTCALLWLDTDRSAFTLRAMRALDKHADALAISSISIFEIGIKVQRKKLQLPLSTAKWISEMTQFYQLIDLSLTAEIAAVAAELPDIHRDPFDRLIIATAKVRNITVVTADKIFPQYSDISVVW